MQNYLESDIEFEKDMINKLRNKKDDIHATRILRFYDMPDLTRTKGNPVQLIVEKFIGLPAFKNFDIIKVPEITPVDVTFDLFNFSKDHPARSLSDTYYVDDTNILRTHTTVMWYYYFNYPGIKDKLETTGEVGVLCHGKVYRKDEIDRSHYPAFHQIDGLYICAKEKAILGKQDLIDVLVAMAKGIYGDTVEYRVNEDTFPYTDPSIEIEVMNGDEWMEILGAGVVHDTVLDNLGVDSSKYNGWAFGPGIERLAMIKMAIPDIRILWSEDERITNQWGDLNKKYNDVSKYPSTFRDISFIIDKSLNLNNYFEIIRDEAGDLVEEVAELDKYENNEKFGSDKISYTFRITYRSHERTLTNEEINDIQSRIRSNTEKDLNAQLR